MSKKTNEKTFTIHIDFDGRREDGEYLDGRSVQARDEDEAWEKFNEGIMDQVNFGSGRGKTYLAKFLILFCS